MFIIGMMTGGIVGYLGGRFIAWPQKIDFWFILIFIVSMYLAYFVQMIIHEAGHLVCGLFTGYRFVSFRIGSFMIASRGGKIEIRRYSLAGTGGQCLLAPPDMKEGRIPYKLYNLGGALFNFLSAGLFLVFWYVTKNTVLSSFCFFGMVFGIIIGLLNGIPLQISGVDNDGRNIVSLGKAPESMRAFWLQLKINSMQMEGIRLKDMPAEWFKLPDGWPMDNSICAAIAVVVCNREIDRMEFTRGAELAAELVGEKNGLIPLYNQILTIELIFAELLDKNRKAVLDEMWTREFQRFLTAMKTYPSVIRLRYSYELLANHDGDTAQKQLQIFEKMAKSYPYAGEVESEREIIAYAGRMAEQRARQIAANEE